MTTTQTNTQLEEALGFLAQQTFQSNQALFREAVKAHPENYTQEITSALDEAGIAYEIVLEYDGGDFIADVNVEFFQGGVHKGRITCTVVPTIGPGKFTARGRAVLNYDITKIKGWRVYCALASTGGYVAAGWSGMWGEPVGNCLASPIPVRGESLGAGKVM